MFYHGTQINKQCIKPAKMYYEKALLHNIDENEYEFIETYSKKHPKSHKIHEIHDSDMYDCEIFDICTQSLGYIYLFETKNIIIMSSNADEYFEY